MKGSILMPKIQESITLDTKNKIILQTLINNSRTQISKIASKANISKPAVLQRIKQMEDKGIILEYITYPNIIKVGYNFHVILIETDKENELKYAKSLMENPYTAAVIQLASKYNLLWMVYSKNPEHLTNIFSDTMKDIRLKDIKILPITNNFFDSYILFSDKEIKTLTETNAKKVGIDNIDAEIINILENNARESLVNIAKVCNMTAEAIKKRIKKLVEKGVILRFFTNFNIFKLGFQAYILLIKTDRKKSKEITTFIRKHKNTNGQYCLDSEYDIMTVVVVKNITELRDLIEQLHTLFRGNIIDYDICLVINQLYNVFLPEGIYDDLKKKSNTTKSKS